MVESRFSGHRLIVAHDTVRAAEQGDRRRARIAELDAYYAAFRIPDLIFELVAAGERWGGSQYNARGDDLAPTPIGFVLRRAVGTTRVEPASFWEYGWR